MQNTFAASDCTPSQRDFARSNRNPMCVQSEADYRPLMTDVVQSLIPLVKQQTGSRVEILVKDMNSIKPALLIIPR